MMSNAELTLTQCVRRVVLAAFIVVVFHAGTDGLRAQAPADDPFPTATQDTAVKEEKAEKRGQIVPTNFVEAAFAMGTVFLSAFILCSIVTVWIGIERLVVLRRGRVIPRPFVERFIQNLEQETLEPNDALALCQENGSPIASIFAHGVRKWGKPSVEVEQAMIDGGERQVSQLRSHLRILNSIGTISPLIGLLGTVFGMIQGFNELAATAGEGREDQLAAAIAIALLTTAAGLFVAIPTLVLHTFLAGKIDSLVIEMDGLSQDVVNLISAEAFSDKSPDSSRIRNRRSSTNPSPESKERKAV
ncbi:MAG: MotA/TolQ/ExbB proton channel family protein [Planctomycetaceae bacterium]